MCVYLPVMLGNHACMMLSYIQTLVDEHAEMEKRFGISVEKEREARTYMKGPDHWIHPLANGGGKGLKLEVREVDIKPEESVPRVFV